MLKAIEDKLFYFSFGLRNVFKIEYNLAKDNKNEIKIALSNFNLSSRIVTLTYTLCRYIVFYARDQIFETSDVVEVLHNTSEW